MSKEQLRLAGAEEFVIKQRCEDILEARRQALNALAQAPAVMAESREERRQLRTELSGRVWQYAYESKQLLSQTDAGEEVWEDTEIGTWRIPTPPGPRDVQNVYGYEVGGIQPTLENGQATLTLHGIAEFVDLSPPVRVKADIDVLESGVHRPSPERDVISYAAAPPRSISVSAFELVDEVVSDLGMTPEVDAAEGRVEASYEDIL